MSVDFYEEAFSLVYELTSKTISPDMWTMLGIVHIVFKDSAFDCFLDLMPALHNYVTIDTDAFLSDENHMLYIFDICKTVRAPFTSQCELYVLKTKHFHRFFHRARLAKMPNAMQQS